MYEITSITLEILILLAILGEWRTSHLHYTHTLSKKNRANEKRKATRLIKKALEDQ